MNILPNFLEYKVNLAPELEMTAKVIKVNRMSSIPTTNKN